MGNPSGDEFEDDTAEILRRHLAAPGSAPESERGSAPESERGSGPGPSPGPPLTPSNSPLAPVLGYEEEPGRRPWPWSTRRPSPLLLAMVAVPWLAVAAIGLSGRSEGPGPPPPREDAPHAAEAPFEPTPDLVATEAALTAVHDRVVDSLGVVPEALRVSGHLWAGELLVVVAEAVANGSPLRFGVPVGGQPPRALGPAWPLPTVPSGLGPALPLEGVAALDLAWTPVHDAPLAHAAAQALGRTGYGNVRELAISRSHQAPGVLRVSALALAPGESSERRHDVWLDDTPPHLPLGLQIGVPQ